MIDSTEAARILSVSVPTLRRLVKSGAVPTPPVSPFLKRPRKLLFERSAVLARKAEMEARARPAREAPGGE